MPFIAGEFGRFKLKNNREKYPELDPSPAEIVRQSTMDVIKSDKHAAFVKTSISEGVYGFITNDSGWNNLVNDYDADMEMLFGKTTDGQFQVNLPNDQNYNVILYNPSPYETQAVEVTLNASVDLQLHHCGSPNNMLSK